MLLARTHLDAGCGHCAYHMLIQCCILSRAFYGDRWDTNRQLAKTEKQTIENQLGPEREREPMKAKVEVRGFRSF